MFPFRHVFRGIERPKGHPIIEFAQADDIKMLEWEAAQWVPPRKWLKEISDEQCRELQRMRIHFTTAARLRAAELGNIATARWFVSRGYAPDHMQVIIAAARAGQLEMVQYLLEATDDKSRKNIIGGEVLPRSAIESGNLELVKWLHDAGCSFNHKNASCTAALHGHTHILRWMRGNDIRVSKFAYKHAAGRGQLDTLQYLRELRLVGSRAITYAAAGGKLDVIKWLLDHDYKPKSSAIGQATRGGHREVILYLLSIGVKWHRDTCIYAALRGAKMLSWVLDQGAPWDKGALSVALDFDGYEIVELVLARGLPIKESDRKRHARLARLVTEA
jgi:hypothetical protein